MKKLLALAVAGTMAVSLAACGSSASSAPASSEATSEAATSAAESAAESVVETTQGGKVGVCIYKFDDAFMTTYRNALQEILEGKGYEVTIVDGNNDQAKQNEQINTFITQGVDALIINPVMTSAADQIISTVKDADVPTVLINREPTADQMSAYDKLVYVGCDAAQSGTFQGELILDEPTSSLTAAEVEALFTIVDELRAKGVSIVYISHKMDEILRISDEVTIMRDGQYIGTWEAKELTTDMIITKMVGRELSNLYPPRSNTPGEVVFEVKDFTSINPKSFRHVNFNVRKGEILGVAGLVGAQRTELMEGLFGLRCHTSGTITYKGKELTINQPQDAIKNGIAMLTEDRRATGILGVLSIADNVSIASLNKYLIGGIMLDDNKIEKLVQDNVAKLSIKTPSSKTQIQSLSGGNQQKVLIARWLANDPDVFIMDEPTRGIDVGAKYEIYCIIAEMAKQGKSIIMISSEMSELIGMSDRIMVMCDGRCTGFIDGDKANQENIMTLATQFE